MKHTFGLVPIMIVAFAITSVSQTYADPKEEHWGTIWRCDGLTLYSGLKISPEVEMLLATPPEERKLLFPEIYARATNIEALEMKLRIWRSLLTSPHVGKDFTGVVSVHGRHELMPAIIGFDGVDPTWTFSPYYTFTSNVRLDEQTLMIIIRRSEELGHLLSSEYVALLYDPRYADEDGLMKHREYFPNCEKSISN